MQQATVGTKYQIVIPKEIRRQVRDIKPGMKVTIYPLEKDTFAIKTLTKSWVERTKGIMKKAWKNIDPIKELERLRNDW